MSAPTAGAGAAATRTEQASPGTTTIASGIVALDAQKLIRSGDLELQVDDVRVAARRADSVALAMGGLVADSRMTRGAQDRQEAELVVRVPSERFGAAMAALSALGKVNAATTKAEDITKAYADLATRLAVKEQTVLRLRTLLDNRTAKLSDVLEVERELAKQVTELEQLKGEQRYYDHRIAVSSITVTLTEGTASHISQLSGPVATAFRRALEVLGSSVAGLVYVVIFILPWVVFAAAGVWLAQRVKARLRSGGITGPGRSAPGRPAA